MQMIQISISRNGIEYGPYPAERIGELVRSGRLLATDLAWREGMTEWRPLATLDEFSRLFASQRAVVEISDSDDQNRSESYWKRVHVRRANAKKRIRFYFIGGAAGAVVLLLLPTSGGIWFLAKCGLIVSAFIYVCVLLHKAEFGQSGAVWDYVMSGACSRAPQLEYFKGSEFADYAESEGAARELFSVVQKDISSDYSYDIDIVRGHFEFGLPQDVLIFSYFEELRRWSSSSSRSTPELVRCGIVCDFQTAWDGGRFTVRRAAPSVSLQRIGKIVERFDVHLWGKRRKPRTHLIKSGDTAVDSEFDIWAGSADAEVPEGLVSALRCISRCPLQVLHRGSVEFVTAGQRVILFIEMDSDGNAFRGITFNPELSRTDHGAIDRAGYVPSSVKNPNFDEAIDRVSALLASITADLREVKASFA